MRYWFKNTTIYSLNIDAFQDGNGDGCGDFGGLVDRLEYLATLGVDTLWLLPIFKTPYKDGGYDVSDFYSVDDRLGDMGEFMEVLARAKEFHLRILLDLPLNHTSDQHPWFLEARSNRHSKYRDFYIWADEKPDNHDQKLIFGKQQKSNWKYDQKTKCYFYHTFYDHQPDLNYSNPELRKQVRKIMHFWLRLGISGFRVDALSHIIRNKGNNFIRKPKHIIREFRQNLEEVSCEAVLLGETDVEPEKYIDYFGQDNKCQMLLNFYLTNFIFSALAKKEKNPIEHALNILPETTSFQQYANFLRNHDELDLERLNETDRQEVFDAFGPDEDMQIFSRGIRRRMAPMFQNDRKLMELAYSLLFSLPGSPVIRYGDEIGMGEDLDLKGRNSVRTVMQWSDEGNAGFSSASEKDLIKKVLKKGEYGKDKVNVEKQFMDKDSFLQWMMRLIAMRKKCHEFGRGKLTVLNTGHKSVLAHYCKLDNEIALAVHNLSEEKQTITVSLGQDQVKRLVKSFGDKPFGQIKAQKDHYEINLSPFGYSWFEGRIGNEQ